MDIFDTISYAKGSVICKMLSEFVGPLFKDCLKIYMQEYRYKNASTDDLLRICDEVGGENLGILPSKFLKPWLE